VTDSAGKPIIAGKKIAGFTTKGEEELGVLDTIRSWKAPIVAEYAETLGANCKSVLSPYCTAWCTY
jgi:hypothetical protein